jgi:Flp pilus assembly protein TadD, contains TPR repeats
LDQVTAYQAKLNQLGDKTAELHYNAGFVLHEGNRLDDAEKSYRQAIGIKPSFAEAHLNLGHVLDAKGQAQDARAAWDKAIELRPE